ncbi:hypothetical protein V8G54_035296 [Vigna mungo]|uniref:Interferon-related developmental regulator N-terminal domain-containing protein n=1 Tax=Vigna mungo TaxID=3915 RepID=A0AAQ3MES4_VIGMU
MGKRNSQRKNAAMLDSDDDSSSVSSSSTSRTDHVSVSGNEEVLFDQDALLDHALDALDEKRFATLLHLCLASIKKGAKKASAKEIALASHVIGLLSLTVGYGDNRAREIFEETARPLDEFLTSKSDLTKNPSLLGCLAIITFVGGNDQEETEKSMDILWRVIHPRLGSNVVAVKPSAPLITAIISAWSFLLSTMSEFNLNSKHWQNSISYLSSLLDKEDRPVRIAAGEALAVIFENGIIEKFSADSKGASAMNQEEINQQESYVHLQGLKRKVINQVKNLSVEAGGKVSMKIGGDSLQTSSWSKMIQLNFLKHFLGGGGFIKHMQRMFKSPNSVQNKARTQLLNKQRLLSEIPAKSAAHDSRLSWTQFEGFVHVPTFECSGNHHCFFFPNC